MEKHFCRVVAAMILTLAATHGFAGPSECQVSIDKGDTFYARFDNAGAFDWYRQAYVKCPGTYEPLMKMTRAYIDRGQDGSVSRPESVFITGLRFADTLRLRYPDSSQGYFLTSVAAGNLCRIRKGARKVALVRMVERNAKNAIRLAPDFAPAHVVLGLYYRQVATANPFIKGVARLMGGIPNGTLRDSEAALLRALALSPDNHFALLELARTDLAMGKKGEAIKRLRRSQAAEPAWYQDEKLKRDGKRLLGSLTRKGQ